MAIWLTFDIRWIRRWAVIGVVASGLGWLSLDLGAASCATSPRTLRCTGDLEANALMGRQITVEDLQTGAWRLQWTLGLLSGAAGFDGRQAWSQEGSGPVSLGTNGQAPTGMAHFRLGLGKEVPGRARVRRVGRRTFRVEGAGGPRVVWVDASTGQVDRIVTSRFGHVETTRFEDYRSVGGLPRPFRVRTFRGGDVVSAWRCTGVEVDPVLPPDAFARPEAPPDAGLEGGVEVRLPMAPGPGSQIFLRATLNGRGPYWFCLDSGCVKGALTPRVAGDLGLHPEGRAWGGGLGPGEASVAFCRVAEVRLGPAWMRDQVFTVVPGLEVIGEVGGEPCAGLLGSDLFQRFIVRLDYGAREVGLARPGAFMPPAGASALPLTFAEGLPRVEGWLDGLKGLMILDTGSEEVLEVGGPFVRRHGLLHRCGRVLEDRDLTAIGGPSVNRVARCKSLRVGPSVLARPLVSLSLARRGALAWMAGMGTLGGGFLERFDVVFDYPGAQVYLTPNARHGEPFRFRNRHGLQGLREVPSGIRVGHVIPGSPAAVAGVRPGDRVVGAGGTGSPALTLARLRALLGEPSGSVVDLRLLRGGQIRRVRICLRDLL